VDTTGLLLEVLVTPASVQDRDAARPLLFNLKRASRRVGRAWADGGYAGKLLPRAAKWLKLTVEIVKQKLPPLRPRLRAPPRPPRSHHLLGHDHPHDAPPGQARARLRNRHAGPCRSSR
jgi:Transposase DDE domain